MKADKKYIEHLRSELAEAMRTLAVRMADAPLARARQAKWDYARAEKVVSKLDASAEELQRAINLLR